MNIAELLDHAKRATGETSDAGFGRALGVKRQTVSNWRNGIALPDAVTCEKLAVLSGIPLNQVIGMIGEARAISATEKKVWRKLAAAILVLSAALPFVAIASNLPTNGYEERCIMRS